MSDISHNIPLIDNEGEAVNVITDYQVDTISMVKGCALGRNFVKLKSQAAPDEGGGLPLETQEKLNKAKALDAAAKEAAAEVTTEEAAAPAEGVVVEEKPEVEIPVVDEAEAATEVSEEVSEKVSEPEATDAPEGEEKPVEEAPVVVEESEAPVEKAKMFTVQELGETHKIIFEGIADLMSRAQAAAPDADFWEIRDIINETTWAIDDALWWERAQVWDEIWDEVWVEVNTRVNKAKALKVEEATDPVSAMKALEKLNPEMYKLINAEMEVNKAKAIEAEAASKAVIRAKSLAEGAESFKRLATEDNTTDNIVDALATIQVVAPEAHTVVTKALGTASGILLGGELFTDLGTGESIVHETEGEYVDRKAKSLFDQKTENGEATNIAAERANVRLTADYAAQYL